MKNWIKITIAALLGLLLSMCGGKGSTKPPKPQKEKVLDPNVQVKSYLNFDRPVIMFSKLCVEDTTYKYLYYLSSNIWVASNDLYYVGDTLSLCKIHTQ